RSVGRELYMRVCFFFQAEDGIRDFHVTGVQTCALPISGGGEMMEDEGEGDEGAALDGDALVNERCTVCHTRDRIDAQDKDEDGWTQTVDTMISFGAQLNEEERAAVIDYLVATH